MAKIDGDLPKVIAKNVPDWHWQRIETGGTGLGIPDLNWAGEDCEGWLEAKWTDSWKVKMNGPEQVSWPERRVRAGGRYKMAVRQTGAGRDCLWLLNWEAPRLLIQGARLDELLPGVLLLYCEGGPSRWDWLRFRTLLKGRP